MQCTRSVHIHENHFGAFKHQHQQQQTNEQQHQVVGNRQHNTQNTNRKNNLIIKDNFNAVITLRDLMLRKTANEKL